MKTRFVETALSTEEFIRVLDHLRAETLAGDSLEGSFEWRSPPWNTTTDPIDFLVKGVYRIGNLEGQGGVQMIGKWVDTDDEL